MQYLLACIDITFIQPSVSPGCIFFFFSPSKCKINKACSLIDCSAFPVVLVALVLRKQRPPRAGSGTIISPFIPASLWFGLSYIWNIYTETNMFQRKSCVRKNKTKTKNHPPWLVGFFFKRNHALLWWRSRFSDKWRHCTCSEVCARIHPLFGALLAEY